MKTNATQNLPAAGREASLDKSAPVVRAMFSDIALRYDFLNHLLSANQDKRWRRRAIAMLAPRRNETILDLCCGTGDLSFECLRRQPHCHIIGADFALPMLQNAQRKVDAARWIPGAEERKPVTKENGPKVLASTLRRSPAPSAQYPAPRFACADALHLPFAAQSFDVLMVGFGVRNFENTRDGLQEMQRVLKPGGRLLVLEFMRPTSPLVQRFFGLFNHLLAPVGRRVSGHASAYNYLPQSVGGFYTRREFSLLLRESGFQNVRSFQFSGGVSTAFLAQRSVTE